LFRRTEGVPVHPAPAAIDKSELTQTENEECAS
jgi:hypothetical protein